MTSQTRANPYVGPRAFQYGETLYGRDREVVELLDLLIAERIVLLYSPSGGGKTSLIHAALIPELEKEGFRVLPVMRVSVEPSLARDSFSVANRYILSLLLSLEEALPEEQQMPLDELAGMELADYLDRRQSVSGGADTVVLIFDQFEEILTVDPTDRAAKEAFFAQVGAALRHRQRWALFAMREEYPAGLDPYLRPIPTRLSTTYRLELLGEEAARLAVQRPARQAGVDFTDVAATKLIDDLRRVRIQRPEGTTAEQLGLYVEPVQLQVVCRRLWERLSLEAMQIGAEDVEAVGDVDSALEGYYAERVIAIAGATGVHERAIREWFDRQLITEQGIRGQVLQGHEASQGLENRAVMPLVDAHLVRAEKRRGATWFELAHDRLIEPVRKDNAAWYQANLSALQRQAALWDEQHRSPGLLLRGEALAEAERWAATHQDELTPTERDFLAACREDRARRFRRRATIFTIVGVIAWALAIVSYQYARTLQAEAQAKEQARIALSRQLAAQAFDHLDDQLDLALLLSVEASRVTDTVEARSALLTGLHYLPYLRTFLRHTKDMNSVALSPDGKTVASAARSTIVLWDVTSHKRIGELRDDKSEVRGVAFSTDGKTLASTDRGTTIILWDITSRTPIGDPLHDESGVASMAFSPDGKTLASGNWGGGITLWEVASHRRVGELTIEDEVLQRGQTDLVLSMAFSADGKTVASGDEMGFLILWDVAARKPLRPPLTGRWSGEIRSVAFGPDGKTLASSSWNSIILWETATNEQRGQPLTGHRGLVRSLTFSRDGKFLISGSEDRTVLLWDLDSHDPVDPPLTGHKGAVFSVALSSDGTILASGSADGRIGLWDLTTRQPLGRTLIGHTGAVHSVAFSADGKTLASGSADHSLVLWDVFSHQPRDLPLTGFWGALLGVTFSLDGKAMAFISGENALTLRDIATGRLITSYRGDVLSAALSREGDTLALGHRDGTVLLWSVASHQPLAPPLSGHESWVVSIAFTLDGQTLASGDVDGTIILWDVASRKLRKKIPKGHSRLVSLLGFSADGQTLASQSKDEDKTVILWDVATAQPLSRLGQLRQFFNDPRRDRDSVRTAFSPDGRTLAMAHDSGAIILWDVIGGRLLDLPQHNELYVAESVAFSPDGKTLALGFADGTVALWDMTTRTLQGPLRLSESERPSGFLASLVFSPDGRTLALHFYRNVFLWDVASRQPLDQRLTLHGNDVVSVAFSPDSTILASSDWKTLNLWDVATRQPLGRLPLDGSLWQQNFSFSPDGKVLALGGCSGGLSGHCRIGEIQLWDVATRRPLGEPLRGHASTVTVVAFSPDGKLLASIGIGRTIILWNLASRQPLATLFTAYTKYVTSVALSPDGKTMATGTAENAIILWDLASRQPLGAPLTGHNSIVRSVAFSPNGTILASGSEDHTIILWDLASRQPITPPLAGHKGSINSIVFSPNGEILASGSQDETIILWDISVNSWRARACRMADRNLTSAEWKKYMGVEPYRRTCAHLPIDPSFVETGREQAREGNVAGAMAVFERTLELEPSFPLDPRAEVKKLLASGLVEKAKTLAREGDVAGAMVTFQRALELEPGLAFDPQAGPKRLVASELVYRGKELARARNVDGAVALLQKARELDPSLAEVKKLVASELVKEGKAHAGGGNVASATAIFQKALELDPGLAFEPQVEAKKLAAPGLVERGKHLASVGNVDGATALFQKAQELDGSLDLAEAKKYASGALMSLGQNLAKRGDVDGSVVLFEKGRELDPSLNLDPQAEANKWAASGLASGLVAEGKRAVKQGQVKEALAAYAKAQTLDPTQVSGQSWNELCWEGSLLGYATAVMPACDQAVMLDPAKGDWRDSRGLARALTGNTHGAIEDFMVFVEQTDNEKWRGQRQHWIDALRTGENPFTPEEIQKLRQQ
jgi:WD40 repeat protein/tetratricopeptide (TPR) repeat protein